MRHEMCALFCIPVMAKRVTLSQHFLMHVVPPLDSDRVIDALPERIHYTKLQ
jgi:hypothetical protein